MGTGEETGVLPRLSVEALLRKGEEARFSAEGIVYKDGGYIVVNFSPAQAGPLYCFRPEDVIVASVSSENPDENAPRRLSIREGSPCVRFEAVSFERRESVHGRARVVP